MAKIKRMPKRRTEKRRGIKKHPRRTKNRRTRSDKKKGRGFFPIDCAQGVISCGDDDYIQPGTKVVASRDNVEHPGEMIEPLFGVWGGDSKLYVDEDTDNPTEFPEREYKIYDGFSSKLEPPFREVVDARCFIDFDETGNLNTSPEPRRSSGAAGQKKKRRSKKSKRKPARKSKQKKRKN